MSLSRTNINNQPPSAKPKVTSLLLNITTLLLTAQSACFSIVHAASSPSAQGQTLVIAENRQARLPIVVSDRASEKSKSLAQELAAGLERITSAKFEIRSSARPEGITIGTAAEWPNVLPPPRKDLSEVLQREDYILKTGQDRLYIIGRNDIGVQDALWDFFAELGFRQFFPGENWTIWPKQPHLSVALNRAESPSFYSRRIAFLLNKSVKQMKLYANSPAALERIEKCQADLEIWKARNRMISGFTLNTAHAYGRLQTDHPEYFAKHSEDIIPRESGDTRKLDASHPSLLALAAQDAVEQFEKTPELDCLSVEPSDGGGWREDSPLGSPSNQAVTFANHVAKAIQVRFPGRKVGMLAYNQHSPPPDIEVDPNVIVKVQTLFLRGGYTVDQLLKLWGERKVQQFGVGDYLGAIRSGRDLPGQTKATDLEYLAKSIPHYYSMGVRYWGCEVSRAWVPNGLGFYFLSKILWDEKNTGNLAHYLEDFYNRAFENVAPEMRYFHEHYILSRGKPLLSADLIGRMYRDLQAARAKADKPEVKARLVDYLVYTRYLELYLGLEKADKRSREAAMQEFEKLLYRYCDTAIINTGGYIAYPPKGVTFSTPRADWPSGPFKPEEIAEILRLGLANNKINGFETVGYSADLLPAKGVGENFKGNDSISLFGRNDEIYVYAETAGKFTFEVEGSVVRGERGAVHLRLFSGKNPIIEEPVAEAEVAADKQSHSVTLTSPYAGLHKLEVSDGNGGSRISWPAGQRVAFPIAPDRQNRTTSSYKFAAVFYVPKDTKVIGGYIKTRGGRILRPDGKEALDLGGLEANSAFSIPVAAGQDGTWWRIQDAAAGIQLLTVPPFLARTPGEGLIPSEVNK